MGHLLQVVTQCFCTLAPKLIFGPALKFMIKVGVSWWNPWEGNDNANCKSSVSCGLNSGDRGYSLRMRLTFLGATETVTGSKFLLEAAGKRILIDCGLFQGLKELRLRNWQEPPMDPRSVDAIILTHAHIDHTGYLPRFVRQGFNGPVYGTPATIDLLRILLPDSAHLQEEEARFRNKHHRTKHEVALPLYTIEDAEAALRLTQSVPYQTLKSLGPDLQFDLLPAGHILGSAFVRFRSESKTVLFTGDIGRFDTPIIKDPSAS